MSTFPSAPPGFQQPGPDTLCKGCGVRPKFGDFDYCSKSCLTGISTPASSSLGATIPTPAAVVEPTKSPVLSVERLESPFGRSVLQNLRERWKSDDLGTPELKTIYRIEVSELIRRRFDLALEMNDNHRVSTTYYGGLATCRITEVNKPVPCDSDTCDICDVLRTSFDNVPYGPSSRHGTFGAGLYTYRNPAEAHRQSISTQSQSSPTSNFALIQCRVVTRESSNQSPGSSVGLVNKSGAVFCAQGIPAIPTHLLVYCINPRPTNPFLAIARSGRPADLFPTQQKVSAASDPSTTPQTQQREDGNDPWKTLEPRPGLSGRQTWPTDEDDDDKEQEDSKTDDDEPQPIRRGKTMTRGRPIHFYSEEEAYFELTNFAPYPVVHQGKVYPTSEHLFQASKFLVHRPLLAEHIRRGSDRPRFATVEARKMAPEARPDWHQVNIRTMDEILSLKFTQNRLPRRMLLDTGDRMLIFNSGKYDDFWGNGADGTGRNELGLALMRLRNRLRRESESKGPKGKAGRP